MEGILLRASKSHRKSIIIPVDSARLAELLGIIFGDGGINNAWQVVITLSAVKDVPYAEFVASLFTNLFGIEVVMRKQLRDNTIRVVCSSMNVVDFLVSKGAVRGHKIRQQIAMPVWVSNNEKFQKAFVRGLVDTDGCLFIHKHFVGKKIQRNIGFCFTSYSEKLLLGVAGILERFGVKPHITDCKRRIYLYSAKTIEKYLAIFGTSNERILGVYKDWLEEKNGEVA